MKTKITIFMAIHRVALPLILNIAIFIDYVQVSKKTNMGSLVLEMMPPLMMVTLFE
jgi:hypothetical protein